MHSCPVPEKRSADAKMFQEGFTRCLRLFAICYNIAYLHLLQALGRNELIEDSETEVAHLDFLLFLPKALDRSPVLGAEQIAVAHDFEHRFCRNGIRRVPRFVSGAARRTVS